MLALLILAILAPDKSFHFSKSFFFSIEWEKPVFKSWDNLTPSLPQWTFTYKYKMFSFHFDFSQRCIYLFEMQSYRKKESSCQMASMVMAQPGQSQESRTSSRSTTWVVESHVLGPSSIALHGTLASGKVKSGMLGTWISAHMRS